jgi:hypothetical protein
MAHRFTDTNKWNDDWFLELSPNAKCLFEYLRDTCDNAGFLEFSVRKASPLTNIPVKEIGETMKELEKCYLKSLDGKHIWIKNFILHQKNYPLNPKNKAHEGIIKRLIVNLGNFDFNQELLQYLPQNIRTEIVSVMSGNYNPELIQNKGLGRGLEGAIEGLTRGLQGATENEGAYKGLGRGIGKGIGKGMGMGTTFSSNIKQDNISGESDFEKKSDSLFSENEVLIKEKNEEKGEKKEPELVEAEVVDEKEPQNSEKRKKVAEKKEKKSESDKTQSLHTKLKVVFIEYYQRTKQSDYYWSGGKDGKNLNEIISKLKFHLKPFYASNGSDGEIPEEAVEVSFKAILECLNDKFIMDNLTIPMLNAKFQESFTKAKDKIQGKTSVKSKRYGW